VVERRLEPREVEVALRDVDEDGDFRQPQGGLARGVGELRPDVTDDGLDLALEGGAGEDGEGGVGVEGEGVVGGAALGLVGGDVALEVAQEGAWGV
jgi:hypothetical protein